MKKIVPFTVLISLFSIYSSFGQTELFVKPSGAGNMDGSSWENAASDFIEAALSASGSGDVIVHIAEGEYGFVDYGDNSLDGYWSTLPDGRNVTFIGGYPNSLEGTSTCDFNPAEYETIVSPHNTGISHGDAPFRINLEDGDLTVRGFHFISPRRDGLNSGSVVTVNDKVGGTIVLEDIYIEDHDSGIGIGAIHLRDVAADNTIIINRIKAVDGKRPTIAARNTTKGNYIEVNDSEFLRNRARQGGVILIRGEVDDPNQLKVENSTFCENEAYQATSGGGAIAIADFTTANVSNCMFSKNEAMAYGGAIQVIEQAQLFSNNNYYGEQQGQWGGAIAVIDSKIDSRYDEFFQNSSTRDGGAIRITGEANDNTTDHVYIEYGKFTENSTNDVLEIYGGAIGITGTVNDLYPKIYNNYFCGNISNDGGAIGVRGADNSLRTKGNTFIGNIARQDGGAIFVRGVTTVPTQPAYKMEDDYFESNSAGRGGAIFAINLSGASVDKFHVVDSRFKNNIASSTADFAGGGAICFRGAGQDKTSGYVENCEFENNEAYLGGAILSTLDANLFVKSSKFWNNTSYEEGGAIAKLGYNGSTPYTTTDGVSRSFMVEDCLFDSNQAQNSTGTSRGGGAIFTGEGAIGSNQVYIYNSQFYNNMATIDGPNDDRGGGAIRVRSASLFKGVTFVNNQVIYDADYSDDNNIIKENGGSDVQDYGDKVLTFIDSEMQMESTQYSNWTFSNTTFGHNSDATPALPTTLSGSCESASLMVCTDSPLSSLFSNNPPTTVSAEFICPQTGSASIAVSLADFNSTEDADITYTWTVDGTAEPVATASSAGDMNISPIPPTNDPVTYKLFITDNQGCIAETADIIADPTTCALLPIDLLYFNAVTKGRDAQLSWETNNEIDFSHFEIERSADGVNWMYIDKVGGKAHNRAGHTYTYSDRNIGAEYKDVYYRLRQVDYDGSSSISDVVVVKFDKDDGEIKIYPNPVRDALYLDIDDDENYSIEIYDVMGKLQVATNETQIDVSNLGNGIFLINIVDENGRIIKSQKILVID